MAAPPTRPSVAGIAYRLATHDDLVACAGIWRDSINDYTRRLNQPDIPDDLAAILRLYDHLHANDPAGFVVAEQAVDGGPPVVVAFTASYRREDLWFLSMLFVLPEVQALGLGRGLLAKVMPSPGAAALATCTDSVQPISNGLYASLGIVPRVPLLRLVGRAERPSELPPLPADIDITSFEEVRADDGGLGASALDREIAALDRDGLGFERPLDHRFLAARNEQSLPHVRSVHRAAVGRRERLDLPWLPGRSNESGRPESVRERDVRSDRLCFERNWSAVDRA